MHRSGTSTVAKAVAALGYSLGPSKKLLISDFSPRELSENEDMVDINIELLKILGGDWLSPVIPQQGWLDDPAVLELGKRARRIVKKNFGRAAKWAWKDPRNCLTLPFWCDVLNQEPIAIICIRNPLEVCNSLFRRNEISYSQSSYMWRIYTASAVVNSMPHSTIIVDFDRMMNNPEKVFEEIGAILGVKDKKKLVKARDRWFKDFSPAVRESNFNLDSLLSLGGIDAGAIALYMSMKYGNMFDISDAILGMPKGGVGYAAHM